MKHSGETPGKTDSPGLRFKAPRKMDRANFTMGRGQASSNWKLLKFAVALRSSWRSRSTAQKKSSRDCASWKQISNTVTA